MGRPLPRRGGVTGAQRAVAWWCAAALAAAGVTVAVTRTGTDRTGSPPATSASTTPSTATSPTTATVAPSASPASPAPAAMVAALEAVVAAAPDACVAVASPTGVVYESDPDAALVPASAIKVVTAVAALDVLGVDGRLRTTVRAASPPVDGTIPGDLWLVGGGDPVLGTDAWARDQQPALYSSLDALADGVVAAGVRRVAGGVVGDDSRYDARRTVETWPARFVTDGEAGPLSALTVNDGFRVWGHPGVPFDDPAAGAARLFLELLEARGVDVAGDAGAGAAPAGVDVAAAESPPVGDLVEAMLLDSDNGTAELLVKELAVQRGFEGSTAAGVAVIADVLADRGVDVGQSVIADGSGLSAADRVSCRLLLSVLLTGADVLAPRLAVAGETGTLARRFAGTAAAGRLRAKTGSLHGVAAIAGYVETVAGSTLTFAYVVNGLPEDSPLGASLQDRVVLALVEASP